LAGSDDRWIGDRRSRRERRVTPTRRSGTDRRTEDHGPPEPERRSGVERRITADRRTGRDRRSDAPWESIPLDIATAAKLDDAALVAAAVDARDHARARFSGFKVGAALETDLGAVITGCNIENATYGLTMCAERVALYKALSEGYSVFTRVAVVADTADPTPPCGSCRQLLWEYCGDIEVVLANLTTVTRRLSLSELLPLPFDARLLGDAKVE
jgi:cytidine deaminase